MEDNELLSQILRDFYRSKDYTETYFSRAKEHYKNYRQYRTKTDFPYANSVFTPDTLAFVEDATAKICQTLFAKEPIYSVVGRDKFADLYIAKQIEQGLAFYTQNEDFEFFLECYDFIKNGTILGTSYQSVFPDFVKDGDGLFFRGPRFEFTDFWDIYPDPMSRRLNRFARYIIRRRIVYSDELEQRASEGIYENIGELLGKSTGDLDMEKKNILQEIGLEPYVTDDPDKHELLEWYGGGHMVVVGDRQVIVKNTRKDSINVFPYDLPVVDYRYIAVPGEFFGLGIPEIIRDLQADKNIIRSQRRENVDLILNKILKVKSGSDIDIDLLKFFPGAIWPMSNMDDVAEHDMRDVTASAYKEEEVITWDMENATGQWRYSRGMQPQREETATGIIRLQQAALSRFDINIKMTEFTAMRSLAKKIVLLMRRFMPKEEYERIIGEPDRGFYNMSEREIMRSYDFQPIGSSITNIKEVRSQQILSATKMLMSVPPQVQQMNVEPFRVNYKKVLERALNEGFDMRGTNELIISAPQNPMAGMLPGQNVPPDVLLREAMGGGGGNPAPLGGMTANNTLGEQR